MDVCFNASSPSTPVTAPGAGEDNGLSGTTERLERPPRRHQQQRTNYGSNGQMESNNTDQADGVSTSNCQIA